MKNKPYKIGLALSGGGVLGAAHIGVIEEIEKAGIVVEYVSGASAGSIIGAVYAAGGMSVLNKFYDEISATSAFSSKNKIQMANPKKFFSDIELILKKYIPDSFSDFKIPFSAVATNIKTGEHELLDKSDPLSCVLASCAYPGVFPVQKVSGKYFVDGGITVNLPAEEVARRCDFTIGSSIYTVSQIENQRLERISRTAVFARSLEIIESQISSYQERYCDFCFKPKTENLKWFQFWKLEEIRHSGEIYAKREIKNLIKKLEN